MPITPQTEKRVLKHLANIQNELTFVQKDLEEDDEAKYDGLKEFIAKARRAFKNLVLAGVSEATFDPAVGE